MLSSGFGFAAITPSVPAWGTRASAAAEEEPPVEPDVVLLTEGDEEPILTEGDEEPIEVEP